MNVARTPAWDHLAESNQQYNLNFFSPAVACGCTLLLGSEKAGSSGLHNHVGIYP